MLREVGDGAYLVRSSKRSADAYTLCLLFDGNVMNYKLFYDARDGTHFVAEKRFETLELLVADGLISMFVDKFASEYIKKMADEAIYEQSPYSQYNKSNEFINRSRASPQHQIHCFEAFTFKLPHYCDFCRNFLWGLVQQVTNFISIMSFTPPLAFRASDVSTVDLQHIKDVVNRLETIVILIQNT
jgi:hypothetical protein